MVRFCQLLFSGDESGRGYIGTLQRNVVEQGGFYWQMIRGHGPQVSTIPPALLNITHNCHIKPRKT